MNNREDIVPAAPISKWFGSKFHRNSRNFLPDKKITNFKFPGEKEKIIKVKNLETTKDIYLNR